MADSVANLARARRMPCEEVLLGRLKSSEREQLWAFWREHLDCWRRSNLNQREYCEANGLSLKRFGNWRAKFKDEGIVPERKLLWRRGSKADLGASPRTSPMTNPRTVASAPPPVEGPAARTAPNGARRHFSEEAKRQIVEEACRPGASVSSVARQYGVATSVLFRWRQALGLGASQEASAFAAVRITDGAEASADPPSADPPPAPPAAPPVIVERPAPGVEIELIGGRRVRFDRDVDPETVRRLVSVLEGEQS
jgi:transposase-like protein